VNWGLISSFTPEDGAMIPIREIEKKKEKERDSALLN